MKRIELFIWLVVLSVILSSPLWAEQLEMWVPYKYYSPPPAKLAVVHVVIQLGTEIETRSECAGAAACYKVVRDTNGRLLGTPMIYAQSPKDFNDTRALSYIGHEVMHAMGADHD